MPDDDFDPNDPPDEGLLEIRFTDTGPEPPQPPPEQLERGEGPNFHVVALPSSPPSDQTGLWDPEQRHHLSQIEQWLRAKWDHGECPVCHTDHWQFGPLLEVPAYDPKVGPSRAVMPAFAVTCTNCGYLVWFNALAADIVPAFVRQKTTLEGPS
jgi:hypothetical protein